MPNLDANFKQGDTVTITLDCKYKGCAAEVLYIHDDNNPDGNVEVQLGTGAASNNMFFPWEPVERRRVRFEPSDLISGYEPDFETEHGLNVVFGRTWHSSYKQIACTLVCQHEGCENHSVTTAWVNAQGSVIPYSVCEKHANYHRSLIDWFPAKKEEVQETGAVPPCP